MGLSQCQEEVSGVCVRCVCVYNGKAAASDSMDFYVGTECQDHPPRAAAYLQLPLTGACHALVTRLRGWGAHSGQRQFTQWFGDTAACCGMDV